MRILEVHSGNAVGGDSNKYTFVKEQGNAIAKYGAIVDYYAIVGKGVIGYLKNVSKLRKKIKEFKPDVIHAQHIWIISSISCKYNIPTVVTSHGTDIIGIQKGDKFRKQAEFVIENAKKIIAVSKEFSSIIALAFSRFSSVIVDFSSIKIACSGTNLESAYCFAMYASDELFPSPIPPVSIK